MPGRKLRTRSIYAWLASGNSQKHKPIKIAPPATIPSRDFQPLRQFNNHNRPNPNANCGLNNNKLLTNPAARYFSFFQSQYERLKNIRLSRLFCPKLTAAKMGNQVSVHKKLLNDRAAPSNLILIHRNINPSKLQTIKLEMYGR